jgi:probable 2-oxoglutarate dehydrogenase E1 component DHKTD1
VVKAVHIAFDYRMAFKKDVVIDLITFRKWGHNELDEPAFTQPMMYETIRDRKSVPQMYQESVLASGLVTKEQAESNRTSYAEELVQHLESSYSYTPDKVDSCGGKWAGMMVGAPAGRGDVVTGVEVDILRDVARKSVAVPDDFVFLLIFNSLDSAPSIAKASHGLSSHPC